MHRRSSSPSSHRSLPGGSSKEPLIDISQFNSGMWDKKASQQDMQSSLGGSIFKLTPPKQQIRKESSPQNESLCAFGKMVVSTSSPPAPPPIPLTRSPGTYNGNPNHMAASSSSSTSNPRYHQHQYGNNNTNSIMSSLVPLTEDDEEQIAEALELHLQRLEDRMKEKEERKFQMDMHRLENAGEEMARWQQYHEDERKREIAEREAEIQRQEDARRQAEAERIERERQTYVDRMTEGMSAAQKAEWIADAEELERLEKLDVDQSERLETVNGKLRGFVQEYESRLAMEEAQRQAEEAERQRQEEEYLAQLALERDSVCNEENAQRSEIMSQHRDDVARLANAWWESKEDAVRQEEAATYAELDDATKRAVDRLSSQEEKSAMLAEILLQKLLKIHLQNLSNRRKERREQQQQQQQGNSGSGETVDR